jgi:hypothetical protein
MTTSEELKKLIDASMADGKISSKERKVLIARAVSEGLDKDEFDLYLDSLTHSVKTESAGLISKVVPFLKWIAEKKRRVIIAFYVVLFIGSGFAYLIGGAFMGADGALKSSERGCASMEDCITNYKFEEARQYVSEDGGGRNGGKIRKIISSEVSYYASQQELDMAFRSIMEYSFSNGFEPQGRTMDNEYYNEEVNWYNSVVESILVDFESDETKLKKLVYSIKPLAKIGEMFKKSDDGEYHDEYTFEKDNSIKDELIKRYRL